MKLIHTGDNHLRDSQFSRRDRGQDFTNALNQVVDIAEQQGAVAILQAGDLLDSNRPSSGIMQVVKTIHNRLRKAGIWMYVVNGDHDKATPHWAELLEDKTETTGGIRVLQDELITIPGTKITIYGQDFIGKTKERFLEIKKDLPAADILMWHTMVKEFAGFYGKEAVSLDELPTDRYQLIALGDIHKQGYQQRGDCWVGYPGSTELCKNDEDLEKTVSVIEFTDGKLTSVTPVPLITRVARHFRINTQEDLADVLLQIGKLKDQNPMIFGKFNPGVPNVVAGIHQVLDPTKAIIRMSRIAETKGPDQVIADDDKSLLDFLPEFLVAGTAAYDVAAECLRDGAPVNDILDTYIKKALC